MNEQEPQDHFEEQYKYVDENIQKLIEIYGGKFVLVYDCRVIDSDKDDFELAKRAEGRNKFDLKYPAAICQIPKSLEEYLKNKSLVDKDKKFEHYDFASPMW